jgi:hypothetical protein
MLEVAAYLEHDHEHTDVIAFLATIEAKLESGVFCPEDSRPKFATRLNTVWKAYQRNNGISPTPVDQQQQDGPIAADSAPVVVVGCNRAAVEDAHAGFVVGNVSEPDFLTINRKYALRTVSGKFKRLRPIR